MPKSFKTLRPLFCASAIALALSLSACGSFQNTLSRGYILQEGALDQVPVGSTKEQVQFVLGTPSTTSAIDGDTYYYISQQVSNAPFMGPQVMDQTVLALYFDKTNRVARIANYGLADGKVYDFVSRTTPTGGKDVSFIQQLFSNLTKS